jgi:hypothetical protein
MDDPEPPPNANEIFAVVHQVLHDLELTADEKYEIFEFARRELPYLQSQRTSYFILGSYRDPYLRRLRIVQHELVKRVGAYPFILGDLEDLSLDRLPTLEIMFALLATATDYIVGVYEKERGGEQPELGEIDDAPYFEKTSVLPRDYTWLTESQLASRTHVLEAALAIYFRDDLDDDEKRAEIESLVDRAHDADIDITEQEVVDAIDEREADGTGSSTYSWVHLNKFRLFELHDRCYPWTTEAELRDAVERLPPATPRPTWEQD